MSVTVPQNNPKAGYLAHREEIDRAIADTMASGWYILGDQTNRFEREFADFLGSAHSVGVASGTDALQLALRACGIGPGDGVITVSHTAVATVAAIELAGATPIFADIDPATCNIDVPRLEEGLVEWPAQSPQWAHLQVKAILPVHLYGHPAPMPEIMELARRRKLLVIEDCAQAHGAIIDGRKAGTWGAMAAFSFYPTKNLGAFGDGGAVVSNDLDAIARVKFLREYGWRTRYVSDEPGINSRLDELQAAILRVKLWHLVAENRRRRDLAEMYEKSMSGFPDIQLPVTAPDSTHVFHQYVIRIAQRDELQKFLRAEGILSLIHYPTPIHLQPGYRERLPFLHTLTETEKAAREVLSLPMFPELSAREVGLVTGAIRRFINLRYG